MTRAGRETEQVIPGRYALSVGLADMPAANGWQWVKLTDIARLESGHTPSREHADYWNGEVPWIGIKDARLHHGGYIYDTIQTVTDAGLANSAARLLPAHTVCLSRTASVGYVTVMARPMATSQDFVNWICSDAIDPKFLMHLIVAEGDHILKFGKGTTHTTIYFPEVQAFHVCLPPKNEQRRIVSKIESLTARSRRAKEALDAIPKLLERFRQSVLAAAFRGDLTAGWREQNRDVEPAEVLLKRIRRERRSRWEEAELAKMRAKGKVPGDDRWKAKYEEPAAVDTSELPELPEGWGWARAEEVCGFITKGTTPSADKLFANGGDVPYIKVYNLTHRGHLDFSIDPTFISTETHCVELARSRVLPADILMNIVGPPLGKVSIVPSTFPEWNINQAIAVFRPISGLHADFLCGYLLMKGTVDRLVGQAKATAGQFNLTLEICRNMPVPIAPFAEQERVARFLRNALQRIDRNDLLILRLEEEVTNLDRSILSKAFRGELVPQDASDEPASVLLERIRAEASQKGATKGKGKRKAGRG